MRERAAVMKPRKSLIEPNHLSRFDGIERKEYRWHQTLQINEAVGGRAQNDDRNSDAVKFLLVRDLLVGSDQDLESGSLRSRKQDAILQAR